MKLENTTLVIVDCIDINRALDVIDVCKYYIEFEQIKFFSSIENDSPYFVKIPHIGKITEYSKFILKDLNKYIDTDYVLIVQHDGFILNPNAWKDEFFNYDYIGAPWVMRGRVVGNGGFSLRSKKLLSILERIFEQGINLKIEMPEDFIISGYLKETLINSFNIKFPSIELADSFSVEDVKKWSGEFGFHNLKYVDIIKDGWIPPDLEYRSEQFKKFKQASKSI